MSDFTWEFGVETVTFTVLDTLVTAEFAPHPREKPSALIPSVL
jgi:hypothetical protein